MGDKTKKPTKQRKKRSNAPLHIKRRLLSAHLSKELRDKYGRRSFPVRSGDTVKIMRGSYKGHEGKVDVVNYSKGFLVVEGVTVMKADGTEVPMPVQPSNALIVKMEIDDKKRKARLEGRVR